MPPAIEVSVRSAGFTTIVAVRGDIEIATRADFAEQVMPHALEAERLVLDLTEVGFIDSLGVGELVRVRRALQARGQGMHLVPSRRVRASLKLASVMGVMNVYDDLAAALLPGDDEALA